jgi:hypothetical protein
MLDDNLLIIQSLLLSSSTIMSEYLEISSCFVAGCDCQYFYVQLADDHYQVSVYRSDPTLPLNHEQLALKCLCGHEGHRHGASRKTLRFPTTTTTAASVGKSVANAAIGVPSAMDAVVVLQHHQQVLLLVASNALMDRHPQQLQLDAPPPLAPLPP